MDHRDPANRLFLACPCLFLSSIFFWLFSRILAPSAPEALVIEDPAQVNSDAFSKIVMSARIMPSQTSEDRSLTMVAESGTSEHESYFAEGNAEKLTHDYFSIDSTSGYFPTLRFTDLYLPAGSAKPYCLHIDWNRKDQRFQTGRFHDVENQLRCQGAYNTKFRWQEGDPRDGADFVLWKQFQTRAPTEGDCEPNSIFVPPLSEGGMGQCWRYDIIDSVCLLVQFTQHEETASYVWEFKGGCYPGNKVEHYVAADPGSEYEFKNLSIEVREILPGVQIGGEESSGASPSGSLSGLLGWLCYITFFASLVVGGILAYQELVLKKKKGETDGKHQRMGEEPM